MSTLSGFRSHLLLTIMEVVVIAALPLRSTLTDANVQDRGVAPRALEVRERVRLVEGRLFRPGLPELVVGRNARASYTGLDLGADVRFGGGTWKVVGVFDAGGSAFDSEIWCDARVLQQVYKRPAEIFQSLTVHLGDPELFEPFKAAVTGDPRLAVQVDREVDYYEKQSRMLTTLIRVLGFLVASLMRLVLQKITDNDVSNQANPYLTAVWIDVNGAKVLAQRVSYAGELGWELYVAPERAIPVWDLLYTAGQEFGLEVGGYKVLDPLRLEKGYRYFTANVTPTEDPFSAGLGFCVQLDKGDFIGKQALLKVKAEGLRQAVHPRAGRRGLLTGLRRRSRVPG